MDAKKLFEELVEAATNDPHVLGLFLGGSRGKGFENAYSDYDVGVILCDDAPEGAAQAYHRFAEHSDLEVFPSTLSAFRAGAALGGEESWARYSFAQVQATVDKTGELQPLIDAKGRLPDDRRDAYLRNVLDAYLNAYYRSLKCRRVGNVLGARLEAVCGLPCLLATIFGLEGRHAPYLGYLERELRAYPLSNFSLSGERLLRLITHVADDASVPAQKEMFLAVEAGCLEAGLEGVYLAWGESYTFMKRYPNL